MKISFIGLGAWATALAKVLAEKDGRDIVLWSPFEEEVANINEKHINLKCFPDVALSESIRATSDMDEAFDNPDILVLALPSKVVPNVLPDVKKHLTGRPFLLNVTKGFDSKTGHGLSSFLAETFPKDHVRGIVSLLGPSFASDVIHGDNTCICAVSHDSESRNHIQEVFSTSTFRVYTHDDVIGAEIASGIKNIIAIAGGMLSGLGYKDNARASLITRGLAEITRFGLAHGAKQKTFLGLSGVGDLFLTCSSLSSRNYSFGLEIGKKDGAKDILESLDKTVEGIYAAKTIHEVARKEGISTPITDAVYAIIFENKKPSAMAKSLMSRSLKAE